MYHSKNMSTADSQTYTLQHIFQHDLQRAAKKSTITDLYNRCHINIEDDISHVADIIGKYRNGDGNGFSYEHDGGDESGDGKHRNSKQKAVDVYTSALKSRYLYNKYRVDHDMTSLLEACSKLHPNEASFVVKQIIQHRKFGSDQWNRLLLFTQSLSDKRDVYTLVAGEIKNKLLPEDMHFSDLNFPPCLTLLYCVVYSDVRQIDYLDLSELVNDKQYETHLMSVSPNKIRWLLKYITDIDTKKQLTQYFMYLCCKSTFRIRNTDDLQHLINRI